MVYIVILILLSYLVYLYDIKGYTKNCRSSYIFVFIVFFLLSGMRYLIGGDTYGYMMSWNLYPNFWDFNWFDDIDKFKDNNPERERYQIGWIIYVMFLRGLCDDFIIIQLVTSFIFNFAVFRTIYKYSSYPFLTLLIFYFSFRFFELEFEVMRESLAIGIFLLFSFDHYVNRKWVKFYIGLLLAYFIHPSSLMMLILPFIGILNIPIKKYVLYIFLPVIVVCIIGHQFLSTLVPYIFGTDNYAGDYVQNALTKEFNNNYLLMTSFQPIFLCLFTVYGYNLINDKKFSSIIFYSLILMNFTMIYFTAIRLTNYIIIPVFIAITPIYFHIIKKTKTIIIVIILLLIYSLPNIYQVFSEPENIARYYPYQNYIFKEQTRIQRSLHKNSRYE